MAIFFEEALKKTLKENNKNVFMLFGDDGYLKKLYSDKISKAAADSDDVFNFQQFEADSSLQEVYEAVLQFPVLSDKKCVILRDFDFLTCPASDLEKLFVLISEVPDTTVFILWYDALSFEIKKNSKFDKLVKAIDSANGMAVNLKHRGAPELEKMLINGASKRGCKMDTAAAKLLVETAGDDITLLQNELIKLCAFIGGGTITRETVLCVSAKTVEANIYALTEKIIKCELDAAYKILDDLLFMKTEAIIILSTISSVYVDMHRLFAAHGQRDRVATDFSYGNRAFTLKDAEFYLKRFDFNKLRLSFEAIWAADTALKSFSGNDRIILEQLIVRLSYISVKGESVD